MYQQLLKTAANLGSPRVLLAGDFMLDTYVYGDALRISPEAPVPVLKVTDVEHSCGGAGSVAADLAAMGAVAVCVSIIGNDSNGNVLKDLLHKAGAETDAIVTTDDRPTINKQRLVGLAQHRHRQQLIRIDTESTEPLSDNQYQKLLESFEANLKDADIVCLQDYNKGLLGSPICEKMIELARRNDKKVLVDPGRNCDYSKYLGATLITPNRIEAAEATGLEIKTADDARRAASQLMDKLKLDAVVITLDKDGAYLKTPETAELIPTCPRSVYDVTGAGDMVLTTLAVALAAGCDYNMAVQLSNIAAGIEVEKFGAATVTIDEIINEIISENRGKTGKIHNLGSLLDELKWHRSQNNTIGFTNGCFDVVHRGHIEFLNFCKQNADVVVVGLNSDDSVRRNKGPDRPVNNQHDRAAVLAGLQSVDYVTIFEDDTPLELIEQVKPDVLVKGQDWAEKGVVGREFVESNGGKVLLAPILKGKSSTATIEKIKASKNAQNPS